MEKELSSEDQELIALWNEVKEKAQHIQDIFNKEVAPKAQKFKAPGIDKAIKSIGKSLSICGMAVTLAGTIISFINPAAGLAVKTAGKITRAAGGTMVGAGTALNRGAAAYQDFKRGDKRAGWRDIALTAAGIGTAIMAGRRLGNTISDAKAAQLNIANKSRFATANVNQPRAYTRDNGYIEPKKIPSYEITRLNDPNAAVNQIPSFINTEGGINDAEDLKFASAALDGENIVSAVEVEAPTGEKALAAVTDSGEVDIMDSFTGEVIETIPAEEVAEVQPEIVDNAIEIEPEINNNINNSFINDIKDGHHYSDLQGLSDEDKVNIINDMSPNELRGLQLEINYEDNVDEIKELARKYNVDISTDMHINPDGMFKSNGVWSQGWMYNTEGNWYNYQKNAQHIQDLISIGKLSPEEGQVALDNLSKYKNEVDDLIREKIAQNGLDPNANYGTAGVDIKSFWDDKTQGLEKLRTMADGTSKVLHKDGELI